MIYGIGNDLLEIERIKTSMDNPRFAAFCFSEAERAAFAGDHRRLAGCFAAKEALAKALGTGVRGFTMEEISVLRRPTGAPYFVFSGNIQRIIETNHLTAFVTLTNTARYVAAAVVLEVKACS